MTHVISRVYLKKGNKKIYLSLPTCAKDKDGKKKMLKKL